MHELGEDSAAFFDFLADDALADSATFRFDWLRSAVDILVPSTE